MRKLTPKETGQAERGCDEVPPTRLVQRWAVLAPTPNAPLRKEVERETDAPEGNLVIVERYEDKADAQQATRLKAARHFPRLDKHCIRRTASTPSASLRRISRHFPQTRKHTLRRIAARCTAMCNESLDDSGCANNWESARQSLKVDHCSPIGATTIAVIAVQRFAVQPIAVQCLQFALHRA